MTNIINFNIMNKTSIMLIIILSFTAMTNANKLGNREKVFMKNHERLSESSKLRTNTKEKSKLRTNLKQFTTWRNYPTLAKDISTGAEGDAHLVAQDGSVYRLNFNDNIWSAISPSKFATRLDTFANGDVIAVRPGLGLYINTKGTWTKFTTLCTTDVGVGRNGNIAALGCVSSPFGGFPVMIYNNVTFTWTTLPFVGGIRIDVGPNGEIYIVDILNRVWVTNNGGITWTVLFGSSGWLGLAVDVSVSNTNVPCIAGTNGNIYRWRIVSPLIQFWRQLSGITNVKDISCSAYNEPFVVLNTSQTWSSTVRPF